MFKFAKYYMLANIYKRTKFSVWNVLGAMVAMVVTSLVFSDLVAIAEGSGKAMMIGLKWLILFILLSVMAFHLHKIFKSVSLPFNREPIVSNEQKNRVMEKVILRSCSEIILDKYRKAE